MSEAFYVPSVPRAVLLPRLDTYKVPSEDEEADPTPPGSHWLFRPPPYVSSADLKSETVTIRNPSAWKRADLSGFTLSDRMRRHVFTFPERCAVGARRSITLHCCPGKVSAAEVNALTANDLLWKNQPDFDHKECAEGRYPPNERIPHGSKDGSLRRKEVLNDEGDSVKLCDARGREIAFLSIPANDDDEEDEEPQVLELPGVKRAQVLALRKLVLTLCYLRLACVGIAAAFVTTTPEIFVLFTALAHSVDLLCRWASSQPGVPMDDVSVVLATMGDRLSALVLLGALVMLDNDSRHVQLFAGMLALDICTNWLQLSVASAAGGSRPLAGGAYVKGRGAAPDFASHLMLRHPVVLTLVSLGNEAFLLWSYIMASAHLSYGLMPTLTTTVCTLESWLAYLVSFRFDSETFFENSLCREGPSAEHTHDADETVTMDVESQTEDELIEGDAGASIWKVVWMCLMVCCAVRQILSCIQALISMSALSSGVIADAAGHDIQSSVAHHGGGGNKSRGRSRTRANGGSGSSAGARAGARSRSRVRRMD